MKKLLAIIAFAITLCFSTLQSSAQTATFGYTDTESVLSQLNDYKDAQEQLNKIAQQWNDEIQQKYKEIDAAYKKFQAEQVLLTDSDRKKREEDIVAKEKEARDMQKAKFGTNGELQKKREELVKPIQEKVYAAIEKVAARKRLDFVFDKSNGVTMLYANPKFDITEDLLKELGIK
ncbi:MAG: OmpH family outer membrane protein [Chitinophagales bacterium]|jgi:outer membrane protein|nr:OmpH family outer membrane protein [Chitinophagales bacterium]HNI45105.1 OmpH family outer membrane protein [Chitinophagales bacterium]HNL06688.1 OmpH family outer membrane protein [Chitinophagales bacterium]